MVEFNEFMKDGWSYPKRCRGGSVSDDQISKVVEEKIAQAANSIANPFETAYWKDSSDGNIYLVQIVNGALSITKQESQPDQPAEDLEGLLTDRLLIWHDEFNEGSVPDTSKWAYEYGSCRRKQFYKSDQSENCFIQDSILHMKALRDNPTDSLEWSGCSIHTNNLFEFRYGRVEAKIKFCDTPGSYTTLWMLGSQFDIAFDIENDTFDNKVGVHWPTCGEIDIAEYVSTRATTTLHYADANDLHLSKPLGTIYSSDGNWHIFAMEWTKDTMEFFVDGVSKGSVSLDQFTDANWRNAFRKPQFLILNHGPGQDGIAGTTPNSSVNELEALCDWVRVYAPSGEIKEVVCESISVDSNSLELYVGENILIEPTFSPDNVHNRTLKWTSTDDTVCTCYGGMIRALKAGTATVTVTTANGKTVSINVTVETLDVSLSLISGSVNSEENPIIQGGYTRLNTSTGVTKFEWMENGLKLKSTGATNGSPNTITAISTNKIDLSKYTKLIAKVNSFMNNKYAILAVVSSNANVGTPTDFSNIKLASTGAINEMIGNGNNWVNDKLWTLDVSDINDEGYVCVILNDYSNNGNVALLIKELYLM